MNGELRLNLPMITDNDKFFQKHYITRTPEYNNAQ